MKITNGKQNLPENRTSNSFFISLSPESSVADDGKLRRGQRRRDCDSGMPAGVRCRRRGRGGGGSGCATPLSRWKFRDGVGRLSVACGEAPVTAGRGVRWGKGDESAVVSARKLTAGLWRLVAPVTSAAAGDGSGGVRWQCRSIDWLGVELRSSMLIPKSFTEGATKWDTSYSNLCSDVHQFCSPQRANENQKVATISIAPALQVQLVHAQQRIKELETDRKLFKKKLKCFLRKLSEERVSWKRRELQKLRAAIEDLKDELKRERQNCKCMNIFNSELLNDLTDAKLFAKRLMQKYDKERKARVLLEDACIRLAKEIEADKSEIEALENQCLRIREEVEEERKMLQMAEVWREERVQMKLIDAKLILENKYCQLNNLIGDLEIFLRSRNLPFDMTSEAKVIRQVIESINIQGIKECSCMPPKLDNIYAIIADLKGSGAEDQKIDQGFDHSSASHASEVQIGSPEVNGIIRNTGYVHPNSFESTSTEASGRETVTCAEDRYSSYTLIESERYVNGIKRGKHILNGRTEHEMNADHQSLNSKTSEISSLSVKQPRKKDTSGDKVCRSLRTNDDAWKRISANTSTSNTIATSRGQVSGGDCENQGNVLRVQWCSPGARNPHIARAMKGCIEWPCAIQRSGFKTKLLEARLASQRTQLRSILKQRN